jgi:predicted amidohydrolase
MGPYIKVALAQYLVGRDPTLIGEQAKRACADIVVFPEMYSNGYARFDPLDSSSFDNWRKGAHHADGAFVDNFRSAAKKHGIHVVATFLEASEQKLFNSALLIDPRGRTLIHHRKVHICDFDNPESACARGSEFDVAEIEAAAGRVKVGILICMDREYPEAARSLSSAGAEIALVPNCCHLSRDPVVGDVRIAQMRGRSFEMVMGAAVANYPEPRCDGHSFATDPRGELIVLAGDSPGLILAEFDIALIRRMRLEERGRLIKAKSPPS